MSKLNFKLNQIVLISVLTIAISIATAFAFINNASAEENSNSATYTINFCANDGAVQGWMQSISMPYGIMAPLPACTLTKDGYEFAGWATADDITYAKFSDSQCVNFSKSDVNENQDIDLFATWVPAGSLQSDHSVHYINNK